METTILLVEDDPFLQDGLYEMLVRAGYSALVVGTCAAAMEAAARNVYQLIILDVTLPDGNGCRLCTALRQRGVSAPILFLTARDEEMDIVRGLDAGGDDYVTKPFRLQELQSRIRALLRRSQPPTYCREGLDVDLEHHTVTRGGEQVFLTPTEFHLLTVLLRHRNQVLTRTALLQNVWDDGGTFIDDNTLSVHISRLREKIGGKNIRTVRGVGYQWKDDGL